MVLYALITKNGKKKNHLFFKICLFYKNRSKQCLWAKMIQTTLISVTAKHYRSWKITFGCVTNVLVYFAYLYGNVTQPFHWPITVSAIIVHSPPSIKSGTYVQLEPRQWRDNNIYSHVTPSCRCPLYTWLIFA